MATWRDIASSETQPKAPVTSELMTALALNPEAIAEGASGAPKIASKVIGGKTTSASPINIASLDDFSGVWVWGVIRPSGACTVTAELSDDGGSSYAAPTTIMTIGSGATGPFFLFFNLVTGGWKSVYDDGTIVQYGSGTLAGGGAGVTDLKLDPVNADMSMLINPQGGESAS